MGDTPAPGWPEVLRVTLDHGRRIASRDKPHIFLNAGVWHVRFSGRISIYASRDGAFMAALMFTTRPRLNQPCVPVGGGKL
jgi:hypothetical protein